MISVRSMMKGALLLTFIIVVLRCRFVDMQGMENAPLHLYSTADDVQRFAGQSSGTKFWGVTINKLLFTHQVKSFS